MWRSDREKSDPIEFTWSSRELWQFQQIVYRQRQMESLYCFIYCLSFCRVFFRLDVLGFVFFLCVRFRVVWSWIRSFLFSLLFYFFSIYIISTDVELFIFQLENDCNWPWDETQKTNENEKHDQNKMQTTNASLD